MSTIAMIQARVALSFGIPLIDMRSRRNQRKIARPRQVAMYLARHLTVLSFPMIGREFGNRDHTTVMHAVTRITELMAADLVFEERVRDLRISLGVPIDAL